jgi:hypothetical protein
VAALVWDRFGDVANYVEPFFGSGAVLLGRPTPPGIETVNDKDAFLANFWRALQAQPEAVARWCDGPVNEADLHARHTWLMDQRDDFTAHLMGDPDWYDAKVAGWWVWGLCSWIGSGWCSGQGPWHSVDGRLVRNGDAGRGVNRQLPHLGDAGRGVNRQLPHLGNAGRGVNRQLPHLGNAGQGVNRQLPILNNAGEGIHRQTVGDLHAYLQALAERLRGVRVCCGDWTRVMGPAVTHRHGLTGVFLDPPYSAEAQRDGTLYRCEDLSIAHDVRAWAIANGDNPLLRIALCGYEGEHVMPESWAVVAYKAPGGYESQARQPSGNCRRERVWFSPHCRAEACELQPSLLEAIS